jgi:predicted ArsR family transcriptional regulator
MLGYLMQKKGMGTDEAELVKALDLSASQVRYHLLVLSSADLIAHVDDWKQGTAGRYVAASSAGP